jgi:SagB-type dehydrogenase family enzyme
MHEGEGAFVIAAAWRSKSRPRPYRHSSRAPGSRPGVPTGRRHQLRLRRPPAPWAEPAWLSWTRNPQSRGHTGAVFGSESVDALHRSTMHGEPPAHPAQLLAFRPLDPTNPPARFKRYPGVEPVPLPRELRSSSLAAVEVLSGRRGEPAALDVGLLGTLLFLANGVTRIARGAGGEHIWFRAAMSAGNLHPVEVYVVGDDVSHYQPLEHALVPLRHGVRVGDGTTLVLTGVPFRTSWKYGERGWRHLWWDAGALVANLLAAADAHGVPARVVTGFDDAAVADVVGVDGIDEVPLALVHLGAGEVRIPTRGTLPSVAAEAEPVARRVLRFPLAVAAQHDTALIADAVGRWQQAASALSRYAPATIDPPSPSHPEDRIEEVILGRGSTRLFRRQQTPADLLRWAMASAARAAPLDVAPAGTLLEHFANVHDVAGTDPGGYRYTPLGGFEPRTLSDDPRAAAAHLCLDQPLGGDAAYTVFHSADLAPLLDALGGRGYRAAQLEAGITAGRLALAAVALDHGATGLTFYDRLVSRYFHTEASPLLATAVGVPSTRPAPSGSPGHPAELRGYGHIMSRLAAGLRRART